MKYSIWGGYFCRKLFHETTIEVFCEVEEVQNSIIITGSNSHDPIKEFVCLDIGNSFIVLLFKKTLYVAKALLLQFQSQVLFNLLCFGYHLVIQNRLQIIDLQKHIYELVDLERKCTKKHCI